MYKFRKCTNLGIYTLFNLHKKNFRSVPVLPKLIVFWFIFLLQNGKIYWIQVKYQQISFFTKIFFNEKTSKYFKSNFIKTARLLFTSDFKENISLDRKIYRYQVSLIVRLLYKHRFKGRRPSNWQILTKM